MLFRSKAPLDELEKYARELFSKIPKRDVPPVKREAKFLPRKAALRLAMIEPVKELRQLQLEFLIPPVRPDFASKPDELVTQLLSFPGEGGLQEYLKREGLVNGVGGFTWERTNDYGSLFISITLTPEGQKQYSRVLGAVMSYLEFLRASPFPAEFFKDRARIAALNETYNDRGEGSGLATKLANQALFVRQFTARAQALSLDYFLMEAVDQPWKRVNESRVGGHWGLWDVQRAPKFALQGPIEIGRAHV